VIYRLLFRLLLRHISPERGHSLAAVPLGHAGRSGFVRRAARRWLAPRDPVLRVTALGKTFGTPLGVAAGLDKNARSTTAWACSDSVAWRSAPRPGKASRASPAGASSDSSRRARC